jgi:hypothetical protein
VAQLVVNFMSDPARRGARDAARDPGGCGGGRLLRDYVDEMTLLRTFRDAAIALDPAATKKDEGSTMAPQSGVRKVSACFEASVAAAGCSMSSAVAAQLASRFKASCEGDSGSAV